MLIFFTLMIFFFFSITLLCFRFRYFHAIFGCCCFAFFDFLSLPPYLCWRDIYISAMPMPLLRHYAACRHAITLILLPLRYACHAGFACAMLAMRSFDDVDGAAVFLLQSFAIYI